MDYSEFEMDNRCVVFYDSGTGGLRLFEKTRKAFPSENYVYFADEKYMPFGDKTKEELLKIFDEAEKKILSFCPKLLVVACNTMSCALAEEERSFPFKTIFVTPFVPGNEKTNKSSCEPETGGKWLLLTTPATAKSDFVQRLISGDENVDLLPQKGLAERVEKWRKGGKKPDISLDFKNCKKNYDYVFLGCTHYGFLKNDFKKIFPDSKIVSGEGRAFGLVRTFLNTFDNDARGGCVCFVKSKKIS